MVPSSTEHGRTRRGPTTYRAGGLELLERVRHGEQRSLYDSVRNRAGKLAQCFGRRRESKTADGRKGGSKAERKSSRKESKFGQPKKQVPRAQR